MTEKIGMIKSIYKTLLLFEDISDINSEVTESDYRSYLNRMFVLFSGKNNEICEYLSGLINLGDSATHENVKSTVFHIIKLIDKGVVEG